MAIQQGDVSLDISAQLTNIDQAIKELDEKLSQGSKKSGKKLEENLNGSINNVSNYIKDNLGKVVGGLSFAYIGYKLGSEIKNGIKNALDSEISTKRLENSLLNVGITSSKVKDDIISFADSFKRISSIDDDAITNKFTIASGAGASVEQYKKIVTASLGFAQATGEDFNSVFDKITRTLSGSAGRIGLTVSGFNSLTEAQLKAGKGIDFLAERYGSFAGQEVTTLSGAFKVLENSVDKVFEGFGFLVASSPSLVALVKTLSDEFFTLSENVESIAKQGDFFAKPVESGFKLADILFRIGGLIEFTIGGLQVIGGVLASAFSIPLAILSRVAQAFGFILESIGAITKSDSLTSLGKNIEDFSKKSINFLTGVSLGNIFEGVSKLGDGAKRTFSDNKYLDDFKAKYNSTLDELNKKKLNNGFSANGSTTSNISSSLKSGAGANTAFAIPKKDFIEQNLQSVLNSVSLSPINIQLETGSISAVESTLGSFKTVYDEFGNSVLNTNSLLNNSITQINDSFKDGATVAINATTQTSQEISAIGSNSQSFADGFKGVFGSATTTVEKFGQAGQVVGNSLKTGFTSAFNSVGKALANGENAFKALGDSLFSVIGDMSTQLGQMFFLWGVANIASGNVGMGIAQIAGGLALSVLGGFLSAKGGGGSGSSAGAGAQSASSGASGGGGLVATDTATAQVAQEQERKVGQVVNIEVQGNMIDDNNKFAKFVAQSLNRGFESDDIRLINGIVA